jgi:hypothetical protein
MPQKLFPILIRATSGTSGSPSTLYATLGDTANFELTSFE